MIEQVLVVLMVGVAAALPGVAALIIGEHRVRQRRERARQEELAQDRLTKSLQEQIVASQKTIRFLTERVDDLERARAQEYEETESLRQETESLRQEVDDLRRGVTQLTRQLEAANMTPVYTPPLKPARPPKRGGDDAAELAKTITDGFRLDEIDDMAFDLGITDGELTGTTRKTRARSLVTYMRDRDRLPELAEKCRQLRPGEETA